MSDLIARAQSRLTCLRSRLRWWHHAQAEAARWPHLKGPAEHVRFCRHGVDLEMHRLGLRPNPGEYVPSMSGQDAYAEAVMAIPLPRIAA